MELQESVLVNLELSDVDFCGVLLQNDVVLLFFFSIKYFEIKHWSSDSSDALFWLNN